jgi:hypothetical protein
MGVDAYLVDERGVELGVVGDAPNCLKWAAQYASADGDTCLRFVDPYGNTLFNHSQIPVFIAELESARERITDERVAEMCQRGVELARQAQWQPTVVAELESELGETVSSLTDRTNEIRAHLDRIIELARRGLDTPHLYLKLVGD